MKKILQNLLIAIFIVVMIPVNFLYNANALGENAVEVVSIKKGNNTLWGFGGNRIEIELITDYPNTINQNSLRGSAPVSLDIDGTTFTYTAYAVTFCQLASSEKGGMILLFKHESGNVNGTGASFYAENYPGFESGKNHVITIFANTQLGSFVIKNETKIHIDYVSGNNYNFYLEKDYNINFTDGDESILTKSVRGGQKIECPETPKKEGYTFVGWSYNDKMWDFDSIVTEDMSLKAVWSKIEVFTVSFNETKVECTVGQKIGNIPQAITDKENTIAYWAIDGREINSETFFVWEKDQVAELKEKSTYGTISFMIDDKVVKTTNYLVGDDIIAPSIPAKNGYEASWEEYELSKIDSIIVKAVYKPIEYTITLKVDNKIYSTIKFTVEDEKVILPAVPKKEGKVGHWNLNSFPTGDIIVDAIYS